MKNNQLVLLTLSLVAGSIAMQAQTANEVSSKIVNVTVYPVGAQVERTATKLVSTGRQVLVFTGLATELDPSSISVSASSGIDVLSVTSGVNYLKESAKPKKVLAIEDSLKTYRFDLSFHQNMLQVYAEERNMILSNQQVGWGGDDRDFVIEDLEDLSDFYRDRLADIMLKRMELEQKMARLQRNINRLSRQLNEENERSNRATGEISVEIHAASNANAEFKLRYMVQRAGWVPIYNIHVNEVDQPLQVSYNAEVFQHTGIDWSDVTLTLTNANPNLSGQRPELHPWHLHFVYAAKATGYDLSYSNARMKLEDAEAPSSSDSVRLGTFIADVTAAEWPASDAITQFHIKTKHNIPSNGKAQVINIDAFTMPAKYAYYCAPKLDPAAFLIARVSEFDQYELLPGQANLFLSNTFVGQAFINPSITTDTLELSLGRDPSLVIKRKKVGELCATKKIGNSTKHTIAIEVTVRNTKSTKVEMIIEDQIPMSSNKDIEVTLDDNKTGHLDPATGTLRWTKVIPGGSAESIQFRYTIKYPSDKIINL